MRLIHLIGLIAGIFLTMVALQTIARLGGISIDLMAPSGAAQIVIYAVVLISAYLFTTLVWRQSVIDFFLLYARNWRRLLAGFWFCAGVTMVAGLLWFILVYAIGGARWSSAAWAQLDGHELRKLLIGSLIAIALGATEEILFRSLAFKYLLTSIRPWPVVRAAALSALLFALVHRFDDPLSWLEIRWAGLLIGLFLLGCLLAQIYYLTNSLACAIGAHTALIWFALGKKTQVFQLVPTGWDISGEFDPRTGPPAWLLFIVLAILFWSLRGWMRNTFAIEDLAATASPADGSALPAFNDLVTKRDAMIAIAGIAACVVILIAAQKSIERQMSLAAQSFPAAVEKFKSAIARGDSVESAASATGFRSADYIRTAIDALSRNANGLVNIEGSLADMPGDGSPLAIALLAGNKIIFHGRSDGGPNVDFARRYMLTDAAARTVKFSGTFLCNAAEPILVLSMTSSKTYTFVSFTCP